MNQEINIDDLSHDQLFDLFETIIGDEPNFEDVTNNIIEVGN